MNFTCDTYVISISLPTLSYAICDSDSFNVRSTYHAPHVPPGHIMGSLGWGSDILALSGTPIREDSLSAYCICGLKRRDLSFLARFSLCQFEFSSIESPLPFLQRQEILKESCKIPQKMVTEFLRLFTPNKIPLDRISCRMILYWIFAGTFCRNSCLSF